MSTSNAFLLSLIRQADDEQWKELDLSGMGLGLSELPLEIGCLTGLKRLVLGRWEEKWEGKWEGSGNSFTEIPEIIFELVQLENYSLPVARSW